MRKTALLLILAGMFLSVNIQAQSMKGTEEAQKNLKPYPETIDDLKRYVIYLDQKENEDLFEVELIAGKTMEVDCNRHRLMGNFRSDDVKGWGYTYYTFETDNQIVSTMMACPGPKTMKFVSGENMTVRYNSRLPIVVYLPENVELKYRIWSAGEEMTAEMK